MGESFSIWIDYLERDFIDSKLPYYLEKGASGITTNPAIFKSAFASSKAYGRQRTALKGKQLYEAFAIADVQAACDKLLSIYDKTDGFVSLEVDPAYAHDAASTIKEAKRLFKAINRENAMIKVPATEGGCAAIGELAKEGVPVNATLVFSAEQTANVLRALKGAKQAAVISVFVSRYDRALDEHLPEELRAKTGIMNAAQHYNLVRSADEKNVRVLFASTGVKNGALPPDYYVRSLVGNGVVCTVPPETFEAYLKGGGCKESLPIDEREIADFFGELAKREIKMSGLHQRLLDEGLRQFETAFADIIRALS
ncbi:MAG: transaldolase [Helicobacteraceae bacterium]|nr:transaldolase [Helicobacteraceae bacterium]